MAKSIQYNVLSLCVGDVVDSGVTVSTGQIKQFHGVQGVDFSINYPTERVKGLGRLNTFGTPIASPTASFNISYLFGDTRNESLLGFITDGNFGSLFNIHTGQKNYYLKVNGLLSQGGVETVSLGNACLTNYSLQASLGNFPLVSATVEGLNLNIQDGFSGNLIPNINYKTGGEVSSSYSLPAYGGGIIYKLPGELPSKLFTNPKEISIQFKNNELFGLDSSLAVSAFSLNIPLGRNPITRVGEKYPFSRALNCPIEATVSVDVTVTGLKAGKSLDFKNFDYHSFDIITKECCDSVSKNWYEECNEMVRITINGAKLNNESVTSRIGSMLTAKLDFSVSISNLLDFEKNILISGNHGKFNNYLTRYYQETTGIAPSGQLISAQPFLNNTGYFVSEFHVSKDTAIPHFALEFTGRYYINSGDIPPYFTGYLPSIQQKSGNLNSGVISRYPDYQNISTSLPISAISKSSGYSYAFSGFTAGATTGFLTTGTLPFLYPEEQSVVESKFFNPKTYDFIVKSENLYSGAVDMKYYSNYPISISFDTGNFVSPSVPFSVNRMTTFFPNNNQNDVGKNFDVYFVLNSGNITKTYRTNWTVV